jgi:nitrite reductase/ring-hydroxylating ferredoxin subunit
MRKSNFVILALAASAILTFAGCKKDDTNDIAQYPVDFVLYLNEPSNFSLNAVGGSMYLTGGTKGIIIYRRSQTEFNAIERNCTFDPQKECSQIKIESGITAKDSCCGSKFSIYDGSIINGPAAQPLYFYRSTYDGINNTLHVYR